MKDYYLEVETPNPDDGEYTFQAASDKKAKRNAKRLANGRKILVLYYEENEGEMVTVAV